jgi:hypothetical protein
MIEKENYPVDQIENDKKEETNTNPIFKERIVGMVVSEVGKKYPEAMKDVKAALRILVNSGLILGDSLPLGLGVISNTVESVLRHAGADATPDVTNKIKEILGDKYAKYLEATVFLVDTVGSVLPLPLASLNNLTQIVIDALQLGNSIWDIMQTIRNKRGGDFPKDPSPEVTQAAEAFSQ